MKIIFTKTEVEQIIIAHANNLVEASLFNTVKPGSYYTFPNEIEVSFVAVEAPSNETL